MVNYALGQRVRMKKPHPCGSDIWTIIRIGMDFRIKCVQCGRSVLLPRTKFEKGVREILAEQD
ncbi:MAG: DUF951 domain-containing protein [Dethiobacter sp.]|jgi:hypothetical protein|nr:DUF951 domain-containing protein [Dethiobacter sp.]